MNTPRPPPKRAYQMACRTELGWHQAVVFDPDMPPGALPTRHTPAVKIVVSICFKISLKNGKEKLEWSRGTANVPLELVWHPCACNDRFIAAWDIAFDDGSHIVAFPLLESCHVRDSTESFEAAWHTDGEHILRFMGK